MLHENQESLFKSCLIEHGGAVLKVARVYTLSPEDRQDLAQEILLQAWRSWPQFQGRASASTWFYRVALNTALAWHRKERRRRARQHPVLNVEDLSAAGPDGSQQVVERETVERLYAAIRQLSKTDAALVLLYGAFALVDGIGAVVAGFAGRKEGAFWPLFLFGVMGIIAGLAVLAWPGLSAVILLLFIGAWAVVRGLFEIVAAFRLRKVIENELLLGLAGVLSVAFGVMVAFRPAAGALAIVTLLGAFAIATGAVQVLLGLRLRGLRHRAG